MVEIVTHNERPLLRCLQDVETRRVRYRRYVEGPPLSLSIPLDSATNKGELEDYKVTADCVPIHDKSSRACASIL